MITIQLTKEEQNLLLQLIDLACKAGGLNVAEACLVLSKRVSSGVASEATQAVDQVSVTQE